MVLLSFAAVFLPLPYYQSELNCALVSDCPTEGWKLGDSLLQNYLRNKALHQGQYSPPPETNPTDSPIMENRCELKPEAGPCKAIFERFYFDQETGSCKSFIWGGCQGVVPFETLSECQSSCM